MLLQPAGQLGQRSFQVADLVFPPARLEAAPEPTTAVEDRLGAPVDLGDDLGGRAVACVLVLDLLWPRRGDRLPGFERGRGRDIGELLQVGEFELHSDASTSRSSRAV